MANQTRVLSASFNVVPFHIQLLSEESDTESQHDEAVDISLNVQPFALGKARPFPDGSEAIIIDSTLAHDTFLGMVRR